MTKGTEPALNPDRLGDLVKDGGYPPLPERAEDLLEHLSLLCAEGLHEATSWWDLMDNLCYLSLVK
jgi:hypothetical protein